MVPAFPLWILDSLRFSERFLPSFYRLLALARLVCVMEPQRPRRITGSAAMPLQPGIANVSIGLQSRLAVSFAVICHFEGGWRDPNIMFETKVLVDHRLVGNALSTHAYVLESCGLTQGLGSV